MASPSDQNEPIEGSPGDSMAGAFAGFEQQLDQLKKQHTQLKKRAKDLDDRSKQLDEQALEMEKARAEIDALRAEIDASRQQVDEKTAAFEAQEARQGEAEKRLATAERELEDTKRELEARDLELNDRAESIEEMAKRIGELEGQVAKSKGELTRATASAKHLDEERSRSEQLEARVAELEGLERDLEAARARIAELEAGGASSGDTAELERQLAAEQQTVAGLREQLASGGGSDAQARLEQLTLELDMTKSTLKQSEEHSKERLAHEQAKCADLGKKIGKLEQHIAETESRLSAVQEQAQFAGGSRPDSWMVARRARMSKMRRLLREEANKVILAHRTLKERLVEVDEVLSKRAELASAYQTFRAKQSRNTQRAVRQNVIMGTTAVAAVLAVLAALSWFIAGNIKPGEFVATAIVEAEAGNRKLDDAGLASWQQYHEGLLEDPGFLDTVAERMKRRAIEDLASPGMLAKYLAERLVFQSPRDGRIELELRDEGGSKTRRILDTYVVALASTANATRSRRPDGAGTSVVQQAQADGDPLDAQRVQMAAMLFGGSILLTIIGAGGLWKKLTSTKEKFERDTKVEEIVDESNWPDLPSRAA